MNMVLLQGKLGVTPKTGQTQTGSTWCSISLGTSEKVQDKWITHWHQVSTFGKSAEILSQAKKGDTIFVTGKLQTKKYEKNGTKKFVTQVVANKIFINPKEDHVFEPEGMSHFNSEELPF